jgi:hypothetical protein
MRPCTCCGRKRVKLSSGQDTDGTQTPYDLTCPGFVLQKKGVNGKRSFQLPYLEGSGETAASLALGCQEDHEEVIPEGAYITELNAQPDEHGKTAYRVL